MKKEFESTSPSSPLDLSDLSGFARQAADYWTDAWQRTVLFWDVMRRRSNNYYEHKAMSVPNVLHFEAEPLLDGRTLERPVNYWLVRIKPPQGVTINPKKRPFVVIDPRAGHGPGIGGFKGDSEIGMVMRFGHPCYFIGFDPEPVPGQTIEDVVRAQEVFLEKVNELHPKEAGKPCVYGNCQAGWAAMMSAAIRPELFGPIITAGAPLSYWAGIEGENPMRYSGGLLGGSWLTALTGDLGNGKFDGTYLVGNFENLNPANTLWTKNYHLWSEIDTEAERFIDFETWWGAHIYLNAGEIQWIVDELFVGNRLATAEITTTDRVRIDLRNIRSPIVCFCSRGDNITPPQQALGWIVDLYESDDDLMACEQTIVYAVHENIGHLGIFVSGGVARKEHEEFASNIDLIDLLPPGLYEVVISPKTKDASNCDLVVGDWITRFERRTLDDIRKIVQPTDENEQRFAAVRQVSEINLGLYRTFMQPAVQSLASDQAAAWIHRLNPSELPYELFSDKNPFMRPIAALAEQVRENRRPVSSDNPMVAMQTMFSEMMTAMLDGWRDWRDRNEELLFLGIYSSPLLQALMGLRGTPNGGPRQRPGVEPGRIEFVRERLEGIRARMAEGDLITAAVRSLVYIGLAGRVDERHFETLRRIRAEYGDMTLEAFKDLVRWQLFALKLDTEAALAAIPAMLPDNAASREKILAWLRRVVSAARTPTGEVAKRLARVEELFGVVEPTGGAGRKTKKR